MTGLHLSASINWQAGRQGRCSTGSAEPQSEAVLLTTTTASQAEENIANMVETGTRKEF